MNVIVQRGMSLLSLLGTVLGSIDTRHQTELTPFYFTTNFKFIFFTMWNISEQKMNNFVGAGNMKYEI